MTKLAMKIAYDAHKNQVDKSGLPYIFHPFYLAMQMDTEESIIVALLHDVIEDSKITLNDLQKHGFSVRVIDALKILSHQESIPYLAYILDVKSNELARKVKLADLKHNSDISRLETVDEIVKVRLEKYANAIQLLEEKNPVKGV
jgi:(p)ppGpp synthase/HD superfamily hydrolase